MKRFADAVGAVSLVCWFASGAQAQVPEVELPELPDEILQPPLQEREDGMRFLPDVEGQFGSLSARPDPLGFHIDLTPGPTKCKHYQGVVRVQGADGTPFLLLTRSGNIPEIPYVRNDVACAGSELGNGNLVVIRMGSREKNGERLRSNRLARGDHVDDTVPPLEDEAPIHFTFVDGGLVLRNGEGSIPYTYRHPGSMQAVGNVLAVPLEHRTSVSSEPTLVMFLDVSNPEDPKFLSQFAPKNGNGETLAGAGVVGLTPLADDHYLLLVTGGDNRNLFFYRSDLDGAEGLKSEDLTWSFVDSWNADPSTPSSSESGDGPTCREGSRPSGGACLSPDERYLETNWPTDIGWAHQTLQFLRQSGVGGSLYLAGARGKYTSDESILDLYRIDCATPLCNFGEIRMKHVRTRHHKSGPPADGDRLVNFAAATSFYVSPGNDLLFYATEHDNDGPDGTVRAGEYRHIYMAHDYSPTFAPTATVGGPFEVDEGGSVELTGSTAPPTIRPFIQLFDALHLQNRFDGNYAVVDYPDYDLDDFDNFPAFEGGFNAPILAWNWFAPAGCTIFANLRAGDFSWTVGLKGTGRVEHDPDLRQLFLNLGAVSWVDFDCDQYYTTPIDLSWDVDINGTYESTATFSAAQLDGPAEREVSAQARHPKGGPADYAVAKVIVRNANPRVTGMRLLDGAGRPLPVQGFPVTVPQVLKNLPVTVDAAFTDAGVLDHQFVSVDWGDGSLDLHSSFTTFNDAFGDGTGAAVSRTHSYRAAGLRSVVFRVRDDDGGFGSRAASLRVITPQEVVEMTINTFDRLFARTPASAHPHLEEARRALTGIDPRTNDGALDMIRAGNRAAAIAFLEQSIASLKKAQGDSAVVAVIGVLGQTIDSLFAE
jgi:hypothetical protein